jgi:hypothetical protein
MIRINHALLAVRRHAVELEFGRDPDREKARRLSQLIEDNDVAWIWSVRILFTVVVLGALPIMWFTDAPWWGALLFSGLFSMFLYFIVAGPYLSYKQREINRLEDEDEALANRVRTARDGATV